MITRAWSLQFSDEWIAAWNSHDLDRILEHYADDFEVSSPLIVERMNEPSGVLRGKAAVRPYWAKGLEAQPPLRFQLLAVHVGVDKVGLVYRSVGRRFVVEVLTFNQAQKITHVVALYGDSVADVFGHSVTARSSS
jgi:ketosteroid isomerase-like protein